MPRKFFSIAIADDSPTHRVMMRELIKEIFGIKILFEAVNGADLLIKLGIYGNPDILIIDTYMPELSGMEIVKLLFENGYDKKIVLVSNGYDKSIIRDAKLFNVSGFCQKHEPCFTTCLKAILKQELYFQDCNIESSSIEIINNLTINSIQLKIIRLLALGHSYAQVSECLKFLSTKTVESYTLKLIDQLGLKSRCHLISYAYIHGLIPTFEVLSSFNNKQQTTNNKQQTTNNKQQTTNNKQRTITKSKVC